MSLKKRILRIVLVLLLLGLFVGYFTFSTLLFKPLESDYEFDVAALISAKVDFYVAKAGLENTFGEFPRLAVADELESHEAYQILSESPEWNDQLRELGIDDAFWENLRKDLDQLPPGFELLEMFGGRDIALAGNFTGPDLVQSDWAIYGRANWAGKLAVSLLKYPGLIGLGKQGLSASVQDDHVHLTGERLDRPLFITRIQDVVIAATSLQFIQDAHVLAQASGAESLFGSAAYNDHIRGAPRGAEENEVEILVDVRALLAKRGAQEPWPDLTSERFIPAFAGRLFQAPSCKNVIGVIGTEEGLQVDLYGGFSSELIDPSQVRLYRSPGFDQRTILEVADFAPADSTLFVYIHGPVGDLLSQVFESVEPALRENLEDAFRTTGLYDDLDQVIDELSGGLHNRLVFAARKNDYPPDPDGPEHDDTPVFAVGLVAWTADVSKVEKIRDDIGLNGSKFGLQGREAGQTGYMSYVASGYPTREYWSPFVPGTGMVTTMNTEENTYIANAKGMLDSMLKSRTQTKELGYPSLADRFDFPAMVDSALPSANVLVWLNPREGAATLRRQARRNAELDVQFSIDWETVRNKEEAKALEKLFPGKAKDQLSEQELGQLDTEVEPKLRDYRQKFIAEQAPLLEAASERKIIYLEAISNALVMLRLEPKQFRLSARVNVPLEE
ncbi:MAG: hypothetical protein GY711_07910 [bacterium]|nr:hypothetical protein [bacterium]